MKFDNASIVESVVWQMRLADFPRAQNRAMLNNLYNGFPPYSEQEVQQNDFVTNVNFLEGTKILHDARRQFSNAFTSDPQFFTVNVTVGAPYERQEWGSIITTELNRLMKRSRRYNDVLDSSFASVVLHGVGPCMWEDRYSWCPYDLGIEDVLVPSNTRSSMRNLPFIAIFRQYTGFELWKKTHGPRVDKAWNMKLVDAAIKWVDQQAATLMSTSWPEYWSPEKMQERIKQDGGLYASDAVPTIDTFDLYFWNDEGKESGWCRRIILDAWGSPGPGGVGGVSKSNVVPDESYLGTRGEFLYDPGDRIYGQTLDEIIHFQFGDASCVAPFRYHSIRGLGFLLYSVCHLQNRLRCRFNDSVFENLMQYFRVASPADAEQVLKLDLINKQVIPPGVSFVPEADRWHLDNQLVDSNFQMNRQTMSDNSASFTQDMDYGADKGEETATRTMAKVNATAAMIGAMLNKAYNQQDGQYREICRRFCIKNSRDLDVRKFRNAVLKAGVPERALNVELWEVKANRVVGSGNKMLQVAMADKLMAVRPLLGPDAQKVVERKFILANSDDPALADALVPNKPKVSDSVHDAQALMGTLMQGFPVSVQDGMNHGEYIEVWLHGMATVIQKIERTTGGMAKPEELVGLQNLGKHINQQIQLLAQDPAAKAKVKEYGDALGKMMNMVKAYAQRLQEAMQKGSGQPGMDPKDAAKIQGMLLTAKTKAKLAADSHAQRTAQRQVQFEQQIQQERARHAHELARGEMETASAMRQQRMKAFKE